MLSRSPLLLGAACLAIATTAACHTTGEPDLATLAQGFHSPPPSARPWTYWFWLNGNITREGITADLEAMARVGIGGVLIMEVDQGAPVGPVDFASPKWRELFAFVCSEAARLGLEVNMNDDAGWCGSGGPWITPEQSMQKVVWSELPIDGPCRFDGVLPQPETVAGFYRDVALLAVPQPESAAAGATAGVPADTVIARDAIVDLSAKLATDGKIAWDAPAGRWLLLRFGHTSTGAVNAPAPATGRGLECDKLSPVGIDAHFAGFIGKLVGDVGPLASKSLVATHIDSWEVGEQNWTAAMREEFARRRGYDLQPFLPVLAGRVVGSRELSDRFLFDLRQTISDLLVVNYAGRMRELAHQHGLRLSIEAYGEPADDMAYAGEADEPMCEFWSHRRFGAADTCTVMASAAHVYGKPILGAEAFTADDHERWREHPGSIKAIGDWAFTEGVNRFVFHRYALQPWRDRRPGMSMGPWGLHYERTQTWWEQTKPWHEYLARCQYLLQQGRFVADVCYLAPDGAPQHFIPPDAMAPGDPPLRTGHDFDACPPAALMHRSRVENGELVLSDQMHYRLLVLPPGDAMTPKLLRRVQELVEAGATVVGPRPVRSPSLTDEANCDAEVATLAQELFGDGDGRSFSEHTLGRGRVFGGISPAQLLARMGVAPDFEAQGVGGAERLRYIHRTLDGAELYFVANVGTTRVAASATFRVAGRRPELWQAESGAIEPCAEFEEVDGRTRLPLWLEPAESVFVVFPPASPHVDPVVAFTRNGEPLLPPPSPPARFVVQRSSYGPPGDAARTRDTTAQVQRLVDLGVREFQVAFLAREGDPAYGVVKTLRIEYTVDGKPAVATATDPEMVELGDPAASRRTAPARAAALEVGPAPAAGPPIYVEASQPGRYAVRRASGRQSEVEIAAVPAPLPIDGPWEVAFDVRDPSIPHPPAHATFPELTSWSTHADPEIRHFSGTATYTKTFALDPKFVGHGQRLALDLGRVAVIATVTLNGREVATLWKSPYRIDVTDFVKTGDNTISIAVVNLWVNRMVGDEALPDDSERNGDGTLKGWPKWLDGDGASPTGRTTFTSWRLWKRDDALLESGLLGPVRLDVTVRTEIP